MEWMSNRTPGVAPAVRSAGTEYPATQVARSIRRYDPVVMQDLLAARPDGLTHCFDDQPTRPMEPAFRDPGATASPSSNRFGAPQNRSNEAHINRRGRTTCMCIRHAIAPYLALVLGLASVAPDANASVILRVGEEIGTGGSTVTSTVDENELFSSLSTGFGSASLAALRVYNESDSFSNRSYRNFVEWEISGLVFSGDTPGTDTATVGIGGQLTALLDGASASGVFRGGTAEVRVDFSFFYFDRNGSPQRGGLNLFRQREQAGGLDPVLEFGAEIDQFVGATLVFPVDVPITLSFGLAAIANYTTVNPGDGGFAIADASNTLKFDPNAFFSLDPGITANAGAFIVDNALPFFASTNPVPTPGTLSMFALGLAGFGVVRRVSRSAKPGI